MGIPGKIGAALLEPVLEQGAKQLEPWVAPFARKIFGENTITKGTAEVLNKTSRIDIDTFSKGLDFDSGLREPLERTYSWAGEGNVEGYEL